MEPIRKINDELAIAGQISLQQLPQIVQDGFKSILNLRSPDESSFLSSEQMCAESLGLVYGNIPVQPATIDPATVALLVSQWQAMPKPFLVHCDTGVRAAAIAFIYVALRQGMTIEQALDQAEKMDIFEIVRGDGKA